MAATPNKVKFSLTIAPDAEPGERELRILNAGGVSNRFRFIVGDLPEITEIEPNNEKSAPQKIPALPMVIDGQILDNDRDYFRFSAKAGATLVLSVEARSLLPYIADAVPGWFDPQLTVYDAAGRQVAFADDNRFLPDPRAVLPRTGRRRLHRRTARRRVSRPRRFRLPADHRRAALRTPTCSRSAAQRGTEVAVEYRGVNLKETRGTVKVPADAAAHASRSTGLRFGVSDYAAVREAEPNDAFDRAQRITPPVIVDGRIEKPGDSHYFVFSAKKDDKLVMRGAGAPARIAARFGADAVRRQAQSGRGERRLERSAGSRPRAQRRFADSCTRSRRRATTTCACATYRARAARSTPIA